MREEATRRRSGGDQRLSLRACVRLRNLADHLYNAQKGLFLQFCPKKKQKRKKKKREKKKKGKKKKKKEKLSKTRRRKAKAEKQRQDHYLDAPPPLAALGRKGRGRKMNNNQIL